MDATHLHQGQRTIGQGLPALDTSTAAPKAGSNKQIVSLGALYAHALAIDYEAEARYREFAALMADYGNDAAAELYLRLAQFEAERALQLARRSVAIDIPSIDPGEYAWLDSGVPVLEARAFVFRMMSPRLLLKIALSAQERAKAFFEQVRAESRNAGVRELATEFAFEEKSHIAWIKDALAHLPQPFQPSEMQPGDPTLEQRV